LDDDVTSLDVPFGAAAAGFSTAGLSGFFSTRATSFF